MYLKKYAVRITWAKWYRYMHGSRSNRKLLKTTNDEVKLIGQDRGYPQIQPAASPTTILYKC